MALVGDSVIVSPDGAHFHYDSKKEVIMDGQHTTFFRVRNTVSWLTVEAHPVTMTRVFRRIQDARDFMMEVGEKYPRAR